MELSKNKIKYIHSLKEKKYRIQCNAFVAEGNKLISDLLPVMKCQLLAATPEFLEQLDTERIEEVIQASDSEIAKASFLKNPQQALAVFYQPIYNLTDINLSQDLSIVLDGIQDPGNLGTIVRLADWYGIENIICSKDTADIYNPKTVQATMGALARVKVHYTGLDDFLSSVTDIPVYGTYLEGDDIYKENLTANGLIVMGNEGNGIRPKTNEFITKKLYVPNYPSERQTTESLNVAIATAIVCSEFRRRLLV